MSFTRVCKLTIEMLIVTEGDYTYIIYTPLKCRSIYIAHTIFYSHKPVVYIIHYANVDTTTALSTDGGVSTSTDEGFGIFETNGGVTTALSTDGGVVDVSSLPLAAIVGGVVGGVVCVLVLAIVIVLAVLIFTRIRKTKTYDIQGAWKTA